MHPPVPLDEGARGSAPDSGSLDDPPPLQPLPPLPAGLAPTALPGVDSPYWAFYDEVAARQLAAWAPPLPGRVLDLSGGPARLVDQLVAAGHEVVHVLDGPGSAAPGERVLQVRADTRSLDWLQDECVDAVLAESSVLSRSLATEMTALELRRVLRPGGRLLLVVESLGLGLARLAEQGRWAELADLPSADVVLVPGTDPYRYTRCFWPEELEELLTGAGLAVEWVRPRTVLSPAAVEKALAAAGRGTLERLTTSELELERHAGETPALHLVASARRP